MIDLTKPLVVRDRESKDHDVLWFRDEGETTWVLFDGPWAPELRAIKTDGGWSHGGFRLRNKPERVAIKPDDFLIVETNGNTAVAAGLQFIHSKAVAVYRVAELLPDGAVVGHGMGGKDAS